MSFRPLSIILAVIAAATFILAAAGARAQGPPPALVVTADVAKGTIVPEAAFSGTAYYREISDVAAEVRGLVEEVRFEEGDRVARGAVLVRLGSELLEKSIESTRAGYEQARADFERAETDLGRTRALYNEKLTSQKAFDDARLLAKSLENRVASLKADLEGMEVELDKKTIRAPFAGVIVARHIERGEWVEPGDMTATLARTETIDVIVEVPQEVAALVSTGSSAKIAFNGITKTGKVVAVIPRGDIQTRTFPVKVRVANDGTLMEGMEAHVTLPRDKPVEALIVPRDAITSKFGMTVVFAAVESKAKMIPVNVAGYSGTTAGVAGPGLEPGMKVVIKGNERLNDGQPLNLGGGGPAGPKGPGKPGG